jgi:hypothetical protein
MTRHPLTPDYADELVNIEMSKRIRRLLVLIEAGEIDGVQADEIRRQEPKTERKAA